MEDYTKTITRNNLKQPRPAPPRPSTSHSPRPPWRRQNHPLPRTYVSSLLSRNLKKRKRDQAVSNLIFCFFFAGLLKDWNKGPHITGYVDFAQSIKDHHPQHNNSYPWASWSTCDPPTLSNCKTQLETCLESMTQKGIQLGAITSSQIFSTLNKWHRLDTVLRRILLQNNSNIALKSRNAISKVSSSVLWDRAVFALSARSNAKEIDEILGLEEKGKSLSVEEASYFREAFVALRLAKEVITMQQGWRACAIAHLNRTGGFSRSLANSCTDWPCLLLELLSKAAEIDYFQVIIEKRWHCCFYFC